MITLKGFYNEQTLDEMLFKGQISRLEYIYHHSQEMIDDFKQYCQKKRLQENEETANSYTAYCLKREEKAHIEELD